MSTYQLVIGAHIRSTAINLERPLPNDDFLALVYLRCPFAAGTTFNLALQCAASGQSAWGRAEQHGAGWIRDWAGQSLDCGA